MDALTSTKIAESLNWIDTILTDLKKGGRAGTDALVVAREAMPMIQTLYVGAIAYHLALLNENGVLTRK